MKLIDKVLPAFAIGVQLISTAATYNSGPHTQIDSRPNLNDEHVANANHLFNAIRGAMRQWDSSWNHNGMSFFLASVPENTQLYHGTHTHDAVTGREWLAFEPEHAIGFARPRPRRPPGDGKDPRGPPPDFEAEWQPSEHPHAEDSTRRETTHFPLSSRGSKHEAQQRLNADENSHLDPEPEIPGYLHVYRTKHKLNLLLIDGMSAGKSAKGTLDSQDYVLLSGKDIDTPWQDWERASGLCNLTHDTWNNKIDGFIRMEAGFEVILCDFSAHLEVERIQPVEADEHDPDKGRGPFGRNQFRFYRAVADRFRGIGGNRVRVDFANLVSAYTTDIDLYKDHALLPRLQNVSKDKLDTLRNAVTRMVMYPDPEPTLDWQSIAEEFVQRYAVPLQYLISPFFKDIKSLRSELQALLTTFVIRSARNVSAETRRCVQQFVPPNYGRTLSGRVINAVGERICSTLLSTMDSSDFATMQGDIKDLVKWLDWPVWKECSTCTLDKVCVIPIWPISGSVKDREQPTCKNATELAESSRDYWEGGQGPGGPRHPRKKLKGYRSSLQEIEEKKKDENSGSHRRLCDKSHAF